MAEAIISFFLLSAGLLLIVNLFDSSLSYLKLIQSQHQAARAAESTLEEVRAWAQEPANFYSSWTPYNGVTVASPDFPGIELRVDCQPTGFELFSPSSALESVYPANAKRLTGSLVPVQVQVNWNISGRPQSLTLHSGIEAPTVPILGTIQIRRTGGDADPIPLDGAAHFEAILPDASGDPLPDITFHWSVEPVGIHPVPPGPGPGNGSFLEGGPRDARTVTLMNRYTFNPVTSSWIHSPGTVRLKVRARYAGQEVVGELGPITLGDT